MLRLAFACLLVSSAACAQTKPSPKSAPLALDKVDKCAPIGRTADGMLVYSMRCDNLPAVEARPAPQVESDVERRGLFGLSYTRKRPGE